MFRDRSREKGPQKSCGGEKFNLSFEKTVSKVKNVEGKGGGGFILLFIGSICSILI